jgi:hypothetical protein
VVRASVFLLTERFVVRASVFLLTERFVVRASREHRGGGYSW